MSKVLNFRTFPGSKSITIEQLITAIEREGQLGRGKYFDDETGLWCSLGIAAREIHMGYATSADPVTEKLAHRIMQANDGFLDDSPESRAIRMVQVLRVLDEED